MADFVQERAEESHSLACFFLSGAVLGWSGQTESYLQHAVEGAGACAPVDAHSWQRVVSDVCVAALSG